MDKASDYDNYPYLQPRYYSNLTPMYYLKKYGGRFILELEQFLMKEKLKLMENKKGVQK